MEVPKRVMLFVDYENVHRHALTRFHPPRASRKLGHIDPLRLGELLVSRRRSPSVLVGVRVYRGLPAPRRQPAAAAANGRQADAWTRSSSLVSVIRRPLRYPKTWPEHPAIEKGVDVHLAVDLVRLAFERAYDVAILMSSDTDQQPALETVWDLTPGYVETAVWLGVPWVRFPERPNLPHCHVLTDQDYRLVQDTTDYTKAA